MSKTIAIRVSDEVHSALAAQCLATGQTMTELVTPNILGLIDLPPAPASEIELRVLALEDRVMSLEIDRHKVASETSEPSVDKDIWIAAKEPTAISAEPEQPEPKRSPVSSRDSGEAGTSTSELPSDLELAQLIESVLVPRSTGGYYFRIDDLGKPELTKTIQKQAKLMGFESQAVKIDGKSTRVWLNKSYCKHHN
jgi:hypothetical protein